MNSSMIIIGAGIGGLGTAAHLAKNGHQVTVLEKNHQPGGRCSRIVKDGHYFDVGPTLFVMPEVYERFFTGLGEEMNDLLDLRRVDPTYHIYFDDGSSLAMSSDLCFMRDQLEAIESGSFQRMLQYLEESGKHYHMSMDRIVYRDFRSPLEWFSPGNLPLLLQLKVLTNHYRNAGRFFQDPRLRAAFTFQDMYMGLSPFEAPATYSLLQYSEMTDGVYFPMGGMYALVEALQKIVEKYGGDIELDSTVERIDTENGRATGVTLVDGSNRSAEVVIANADLPYVYQNLLPDSRQAARMDRLRYSCSTLTFYWGLDKTYPQLQPHNLFLAEDYRGDFEAIIEEYSVAENTSCYVHAPTRVDPSMAPEGEDTVLGIVPVGRINSSIQQDWTSIKDRARRSVINRLEMLGINDFEEHIKFELCVAPQDWHTRFNLVHGSTHGLAHTLGQMGYMRPGQRHKHIPNLYFTGSSTHPGSGVPTVLTSSELVSKRISEDLERSI